MCIWAISCQARWCLDEGFPRILFLRGTGLEKQKTGKTSKNSFFRFFSSSVQWTLACNGLARKIISLGTEYPLFMYRSYILISWRSSPVAILALGCHPDPLPSRGRNRERKSSAQSEGRPNTRARVTTSLSTRNRILSTLSVWPKETNIYTKLNENFQPGFVDINWSIIQLWNSLVIFHPSSLRLLSRAIEDKYSMDRNSYNVFESANSKDNQNIPYFCSNSTSSWIRISRYILLFNHSETTGERINAIQTIKWLKFRALRLFVCKQVVVICMLSYLCKNCRSICTRRHSCAHAWPTICVRLDTVTFYERVALDLSLIARDIARSDLYDHPLFHSWATRACVFDFVVFQIYSLRVYKKMMWLIPNINLHYPGSTPFACNCSAHSKFE